jgi:integrase
MKNIDPTKYQSANVSGVRFRYHKTRKYKTRPDKYWAIYYWYDGKRKDEGVGWSGQGFTKGNAIDYLRELKNNHLTKRGPQTLKEMRGVEAAQRANEQVEAEEKEKQNITFKNFFYDVYFPLQQTNTKPESWRRAESHARIWLNPVLGHLPIKDIKSEQLEVLKKKMLDDYKAPRSIQYVFTTFGQTWRLANSRGIVTGVIPSKEVKLPKFDNKVQRFFTRKEADDLLAKIQSKSEMWYKICLMSLHTGMRVGEVYSLTWGDVNLQTKAGIARNTKSAGRTRHIYFTEQANDILKAMYYKQQPNELVFPSRGGRMFTEVSSTVYRSIGELGYNLSVSDRKHRASCHTFRHTYASWLAQSGKVSLYELKELLGHQTIQQTERYSHLLPEGIKTAASKFEGIIS